MAATMECYRTPTTASFTEPLLKPEGKRLRRKLQKIGGIHQRSHSAPKSTIKDKTTDTPRSVFFADLKSWKKEADVTPVVAAKPVVSTPPDLSDSKWSAYVRRSSFLSPGPRRLSVQARAPPSPASSHTATLVPELAHLALGDSPPPEPLSKQSTETLSSDDVSSPATPTSSSSLVRRYAKTPVRTIGQLEGLSRKPAAPAPAPPETTRLSEAERLAESYRALLESRCSVWEDSHPPRHPQPMAIPPYNAGSKPHAHGAHYPTEPIIADVTQPPMEIGSPIHSGGGFGAFGDDAIYFKPRSCSTEAPPPPPPPPKPLAMTPAVPPRVPRPRREQPASSVASGSPSLQIACDLLTKELSSAVSGSAVRPSSETSALQVWVMIEAYEKLRDQVQERRLPRDQQQATKAMLDTWLKALYAVHNDMTGHDGAASESDYGDFEE